MSGNGEALVRITPAPARGMIALRGAPDGGGLAAAVRKASGLDLPPVRRVTFGAEGARALAWMGPDEFLLMLPPEETDAALAGLEAALAGDFALVADVSDMRAVFRLEGAGWRETLAKLCPVDFAPAAFGPGDIRRSRAAQVAAAVWCEAEDVAHIACFRSVAGYMGDLLANAARPGGATGLYGRG